MASGIRSIVWRSDIDAGRERPAFFFVRRSAEGRTQLTGQLVEPSLRAQLTQLIPAFLGRNGGEERKREKEREGEERRGDGEVIC